MTQPRQARRRRRIKAVALAALLLVSGCSAAQLERTGDAMIRVERSTTGVVDGVSATKDLVLSACKAKELPTEEERLACVKNVLEAVRGTEVAVAAVRAALITFWTLYPILEEKASSGGRVSAAELAELARHADRVVAAYRQLAESARKAQQP